MAALSRRGLREAVAGRLNPVAGDARGRVADVLMAAPRSAAT
jgi:hypothetical protein